MCPLFLAEPQCEGPSICLLLKINVLRSCWPGCTGPPCSRSCGCRAEGLGSLPQAGATRLSERESSQSFIRENFKGLARLSLSIIWPIIYRNLIHRMFELDLPRRPAPVCSAAHQDQAHGAPAKDVTCGPPQQPTAHTVWLLSVAF